MKKAYILYTCDSWHTHASKQVIGVATSLDKAIGLINEYSLDNNGVQLTSQEVELLQRNKQTQGYDESGIGDGNIDEFLIEEWVVNEL